jgi:prepilin-type N-terminal cleavage/methylation domain-containing protein
MTATPTAARGFTLVEAVVVLVITGLVASVAMQGFGTILGTRATMTREVGRLHDIIIERNLISEPLRGIIPDYKEQPNVFKGGTRDLRGLTIRPLDKAAGAPRPFQVRFAYDLGQDETALVYVSDRGETYTVSQWSGNVGRFTYRDISGAWTETWPPSDDDTLPQTPWLIRAETGLDSNPVVVVFVSSPHDRRFRIQDVGLAGTTAER